jgi:hypothetical protein
MYFVPKTHKVDVLHKKFFFKDVDYLYDFREDMRELQERLVGTN